MQTQSAGVRFILKSHLMFYSVQDEEAEYPRGYKPGRASCEAARLPIYLFLQNSPREMGTRTFTAKELHGCIGSWWLRTRNKGLPGNSNSTRCFLETIVKVSFGSGMHMNLVAAQSAIKWIPFYVPCPFLLLPTTALSYDVTLFLCWPYCDEHVRLRKMPSTTG